jgi:hypothetical protein
MKKDNITSKLDVLYEEMMDLGILQKNDKTQAYQLSRKFVTRLHTRDVTKMQLEDIIEAVNSFGVDDIEALSEYSAVIMIILDVIKERRSES